jgi:uncharacterized protein (TIGR00369 family)
MSAITEPSQELLERTRRQAHSSCTVCGWVHRCGLGLRFSLQDDGSVRARFVCSRSHEGFPDILHGGIISSLLDGAMTNCLFAYGIAAVTAELVIRFRRPIATGTPLTVVGAISRSTPPLHVLEAKIIQDATVMAIATGKFMEMNALPQRQPRSSPAAP